MVDGRHRKIHGALHKLANLVSRRAPRRAHPHLHSFVANAGPRLKSGAWLADSVMQVHQERLASLFRGRTLMRLIRLITAFGVASRLLRTGRRPDTSSRRYARRGQVAWRRETRAHTNTMFPCSFLRQRRIIVSSQPRDIHRADVRLQVHHPERSHGFQRRDSQHGILKLNITALFPLSRERAVKFE